MRVCWVCVCGAFRNYSGSFVCVEFGRCGRSEILHDSPQCSCVLKKLKIRQINRRTLHFTSIPFFLLSRGFLFIVYSNILQLKFVYILIVIYNHSRVQLRSSPVNHQNKAHMIVPQTCRLHFIYALMIACLTMFHKKKKRKQNFSPFPEINQKR